MCFQSVLCEYSHFQFKRPGQNQEETKDTALNSGAKEFVPKFLQKAAQKEESIDQKSQKTESSAQPSQEYYGEEGATEGYEQDEETGIIFVKASENC